ncbi:MAG: hypothetical protein U1C71_00175 [archaeon]|nr:hypothetical protein [archaeon]
MAAPELIPFRFEWKWLVGPIVLILVAGALILLFPDPLPPAPGDTTPHVNPDVIPGLSVSAAKALANDQCSLSFDCTHLDCLEKIVVQVDSASHTIDAILRTPAPKEFRDHLRQAIKRGVTVRLILDPTLNPQFFLEGAHIRIKSVTKFVATNFLLIDGESVIFGTDPRLYAQAPDVIEVACEEHIVSVYRVLFDRVWGNESAAFTPETDTEEAIGDDALLSDDDEGGVYTQETCGPDTFTCVDTTKVWQAYSCDGTSCVYQIIPLYYSADCGYDNPGFGPDGNPLVIISEVEFDEGSIAKEFLEFLALQSLELSHFTLLRDDVPLITFPEPYILHGAARVHTGQGTNTPTTIYLDLNQTLWNIPGTKATLINPFGKIVAEQVFT